MAEHRERQAEQGFMARRVIRRREERVRQEEERGVMTMEEFLREVEEVRRRIAPVLVPPQPCVLLIERNL